MKKIIALFTVMIMLFASMAAPVFAEGGFQKYGEFSYSVNEDGTITITFFDSFSSTTENVVIPETIDGKIVARIGDEAFRYASQIKTVSMPDTIVEIGTNAFESCVNLKSVTLSKGLKKLGISSFAYCRKLEQIELSNSIEEICDAAFSGCWELESVTIPDSVTVLGSLIFDDCKNLKEVKLPNSIKTLGVGVFYDCVSLTDIIIPESVESIYDIVFFNCSSLKSVTIPKNVKSLGAMYEDPEYFNSEGLQMFAGCSMLEEIIVADGNSNYVSVDGVLYDKEKTMLLSYPAAKAEQQYVVEPTVTSIMPYSVYGAKNLKNIQLPSNLKRIGSFAFSKASQLEKIDISMTDISLGKEIFRECENLKIATLPQDIEEIPFGLFFECSKLESINIPQTVKRINPYAFGSCKSLTSAVIPEGVESIGYGAFGNCSNLSKVSIPSTVNMIEDASFSSTNLSEVTIPGHLHYLGDSAFAWNPKLTLAYFKADAPEMWNGLNVFYGAADNFTINVDKDLKDWNMPKHNNYAVAIKTPSIPDDDTVPDSSSGTGSNTEAGNTAIDKSEGLVTVTVKPEIKGDICTVEISDKVIEDIIKSIDKNEKLAIKVDLQASADIKNLEYTLSKNILEKINGKCSGLVVESVFAKLELDRKSIEKIIESASDKIKISIKTASKDALSQEVKDKLGNRPAFEFLISSGDKIISDFGKGKVSISISYNLDKSEKASNIAMYYINGNNAEVVKYSKFDKDTNEIKFFTNHFSVYAVGYAENNFADVNDSAWYTEAVGFASSRELFNGDENGNFSPEGKMTRGMLVTVLGRLEGIEVSGKISPFTDVDSAQYYAPYVAWAYDIGIMNGKGDNKFCPDDAVTREEIAVILTNYAEYLGIELTQTTVDFSDKEQISSWAFEAVSKIQSLNIFAGKPGNMFDPSNNATRAEIATVIMKFTEFLMK